MPCVYVIICSVIELVHVCFPTRERALVFVYVHRHGAEPSLHASVLPAANCIAAESRKSLWGRDKNGKAAPRTRSTNTTPDPS